MITTTDAGAKKYTTTKLDKHFLPQYGPLVQKTYLKAACIEIIVL